MLSYYHSASFSVSNVFTLVFTLQLHPPPPLIFPFPILPFLAFTPLEFLTGSALFLPTLPSDLYDILYLLLPFSSFVIFQILLKYFSWNKSLDDMQHWTNLMKVGLKLIWPSIHIICGNYVLQKHTSFNCISWSQSELFLLFWRHQQEKRQVFWLLPFSSPTDTSLSLYNSFLILQSSLLPFENENHHGL